MLDPAFMTGTTGFLRRRGLGLARGITTLCGPTRLQKPRSATDLDAIAQGCAEGAIFADAFDASLAAAIATRRLRRGPHVHGTDWYPDADDTLHAFPARSSRPRRGRRRRRRMGCAGCFPSRARAGPAGRPTAAGRRDLTPDPPAPRPGPGPGGLTAAIPARRMGDIPMNQLSSFAAFASVPPMSRAGGSSKPKGP